VAISPRAPSAQQLQVETPDRLLGRWHRAIVVLADPSRRSWHSTARETINLIRQEWKRRIALEKWFPWPSTEVMPSDGGEFDLTGEPDAGMLSTLGYHVGLIKGKKASVRQLILRQIFEGELPPVHSADYVRQWTEPGSPSRLRKLAETLAALARNEKRRRTANLELAVRQRETDLAFLYNEYYIGKFDFEWPPIDA
jgi:hypothetical protein